MSGSSFVNIRAHIGIEPLGILSGQQLVARDVGGPLLQNDCEMQAHVICHVKSFLLTRSCSDFIKCQTGETQISFHPSDDSLKLTSFPQVRTLIIMGFPTSPYLRLK